MFEKFIQFFIPMLKMYNKNNKVEEVWDMEKLTQLDAIMKELAIFDVIFDNRELHVRLLGVIDFVHSVASKRKFKDKYIKNFLDDVWYLNYVYNENKEVIKENYGEYKDSIYYLPAYQSKSVENYTNLLLSKVIDYIPDTDKGVNQFKQTLDLFDSLKARLEDYIADGLGHWVLPFTEKVDYIPISLRYLNVYGNLGDRILDWVEAQQETKLEKLLRDRGYHVYAGWSNLNGVLRIKESSENKAKVEVQQKPKVISNEVTLSRQAIEKVSIDVYNHLFMYLYCDKFDYRNPEHVQGLYRTIAFCISLQSGRRPINENQGMYLMRIARQLINKNQVYRRRKDRKYWLLEIQFTHINAMLKQFSKQRAEEGASVLAAHAFDVCIPSNDKWEDVVKQHLQFLKRTYNTLCVAESKYNDEEIKYFLTLWDSYLEPRYSKLVDDNKKWLFRASLNYGLNIRDFKMMDEAFDNFKRWFKERHRRWDNQKWLDDNRDWLTFLSYANKQYLLDKLEQELADEVINYGDAVRVFKDATEILRNDLKDKDVPLDKGIENKVVLETIQSTIGEMTDGKC